jgi:hypothetical protein
MLWVALHFPQFRRQALSRGHALPEPEQEALAAVAAWACQFTPRVSLEPPQALLLEVEGSLRYFGGRWKFLARLRAGLTGLGFEARIAEAPAARAALWRARGGGGRLDALPVAVLGLDAPQMELLAGLGIGTLGGLLRLPRDGIARRFGVKLLDELDRAAISRRRRALPHVSCCLRRCRRRRARCSRRGACSGRWKVFSPHGTPGCASFASDSSTRSGAGKSRRPMCA